MSEKQPIESWNRDYFEQGGGDALLFLVIFGSINTQASLSRSKYRCEGIPEGLDMMTYGPSSHPEVVDSFREGYPWENLQTIDPELAMKVTEQDSCLVLRGDFPDPSNLDYLRDTVGLATHFMDQGGIAIYDPQMLAWWSPREWDDQVFSPAKLLPKNQVVILVSDEDDQDTEWVHTRGLRKFGRPDLSIPSVPSSQKEAVIDMCQRFINLQVFGGVIEEGQKVRMESLPEGLTCHHAGDLDDPDFNNVHVNITRHY